MSTQTSVGRWQRIALGIAVGAAAYGDGERTLPCVTERFVESIDPHGVDL